MAGRTRPAAGMPFGMFGPNPGAATLRTAATDIASGVGKMPLTGARGGVRPTGVPVPPDKGGVTSPKRAPGTPGFAPERGGAGGGTVGLNRGFGTAGANPSGEGGDRPSTPAV